MKARDAASMQDLDIPMKRLQAADKLLGWLVCAALQPLRWLRARGSCC